MNSPKLIADSNTIDFNDYDCQVEPKWNRDIIIHTSVITGKKTIVNKADDPGKGRFICEIVVFNKDTAIDYIAINDVVDFYLYEDQDIHFNCIVKDVQPFASGKKYLRIDSAIITLESEDYIYNPMKVATPVADPSGGNYTIPPNVSVELTCNTPGALIYYTTNGTSPDTGDTLYTTPITISNTTTLKAKAYVDGMNSSEIMTEIYTKIIT